MRSTSSPGLALAVSTAVESGYHAREGSGSPAHVESYVGGTDKAGIGWVQGTIVSGSRADVLELVGRYLGSVEDRAYGSRWYAEGATVGLNGSTVQWAARGGTPETFVQVTQTDCDGLGTAGTLALLGELTARGFKVTRLDTYLDASDSPRPSQVYGAWEAGLKVSRSREAGLQIRSGRRAEKATFGSRQSNGYLRVYEDDGHGPGVRWEFEGHREVAEAMASALLSGVAVARLHWGVVTRLVDFRDRSTAAHGERAERLGWFAALVDGAEAVRVVAAVRVDHLARRAAWLVRQVLPSLATVWTGYGDGWLNDALRDGLDRLRPRDLAVLRAAAW